VKSCLVVDDSEVIRKVARHFLESLDFDVAEAENGELALEYCKTDAPDIVIIDWQMPVMSPIEFLSALRFAKSVRRPFIVYATTENDAKDLSRVVTAGVDDVLLKPFERADFEAKFKPLRSRAA